MAALALGAAFVFSDPAQLHTAAGQARLARAWHWPELDTFDPAALLAAARGALVALLALAAQLGLGRLLRPGLGFTGAFALGFGLHVAWAFLLGVAGLFHPALAALPLLGILGLRRPLPAPSPWLLLALLPAVFDALAPPVDTDEIYQHLALAREILRQGGLVGGFDHPDGSRPMAFTVVYAGLLGIGGEAAPRLYHLGVVGLLLASVAEVARRRFGRAGLGPWLLLGSHSVLVEAGLAYNDLGAALFVLLAADRLLEDDSRGFGLAAGLALASKYTAAPALLGLGLAHLLQRRRLPWGAAWALLPLAPWWLHNAAQGLHPLFPYAGWPAEHLVFSWPQKYGLGHGALDWLLLPWRVLMSARTDSFAFLGRLSLAWGLAIPAALWAGRRHPWAIALVVGFAGWAAGPQLFRYLLPLLGLAACFVAASALRGPVLLLLLLSLPHNLAPLLVRLPEKVAVAAGVLSRDAYLASNLSAWGAVKTLRDEVPHDAPVALLFAWQGYHVPQPWRLGSVEDHIPTRWWLETHGDDALRRLRAQGVRYLLVGDIFFLRKDYPFLDDAAFSAQLDRPQKRLRALLEAEAVRVHASRRWEVWRLDDPQPVH